MEWVIIALLITLLILSAINLLLLVFKTPETDLKQILPGRLRQSKKVKPKSNDEDRAYAIEQRELKNRPIL